MKKEHSITFFALTFSLFTCVAFAQHPSAFKYNLDKKDYSISGQELSAIRSHVKDWLKAHDTIIVKGGISNIRFTPDDMMLAECDSAGEKINYYKAKFNGFPATDVGAFYGGDIFIKNKTGGYDRCVINLSYFFEVVKLWYPGGVVLYKKTN
jgi:hypothetical protein